MPVFQVPERTVKKRKSDQSDTSQESNKRPNFAPGLERGQSPAGERYWMVQWRAPQHRKHKTWDGDGVLAINGMKAALYDLDGKLIVMGQSNMSVVNVGTNLTVNGKDMEVDCAIPRSEFFSGACFGKNAGTSSTSTGDAKPSYASSSSLSKKFTPLKPVLLNPSKPGPSRTAALENTDKKGISLHPVDLVQAPAGNENLVGDHKESYWTANWRKPQQRKHKTWDGDGYVTFSGKKLTMISDDGKLMGSTKWNGEPLRPGYSCHIGGKTVELDAKVSAYQVPRIIGVVAPDSIDLDDVETDLEARGPLAADDDATPVVISVTSTRKAAIPVLENDEEPPVRASTAASLTKFVAPTNFYAKPSDPNKGKGPLHDPNADGAVVMKAPTKEHEKKYNTKNRPVVPVVIDPVLARHLRPHQIEGVKFLYECVMGIRKHEGQGCILADEMGMGKTLQTITLVWTVLKQTPYAGGPPIAGKVLIVCPVTLVNNWKKEFHKWLGKDRVGVFVGDKDKTVIKQFVNSKIHQVLVIGYEKLRTVIAELAYSMPPIGLIICDEGHRLKSANNKTSAMFDALRTPKRIILSGTPIQNDLGEFHAMADFCNPGLLDDYSTFKRVYETPILKSRAPGCSKKELEIGEARAAQLLTISKSFVLRREATILQNYLPPKYEYVVFVTPTALQKAMFSKILHPDTLSSIIRGSTARSLALIGILTKISNTPMLLKAAVEKGKGQVTQANGDAEGMGESSFEDALKLIPERSQPEDVSLSGKLAALANILRAIRKHTEEKCILVSHYTSTLNIIESFCKKKNYTYLRLDGQTPVSKRQEYVDTFNRSSQANQFLFLLSAKAGGVGLNLIGASRLVLIDSDWNPSHDLQAMARIHRDGQKRPVFIYRLLTAGTIDEKIYQRQVTKLGLSDSLLGTGAADGGGKSKSDSFTAKDLRDLFTIQHNTGCHTHDLLDCPCSYEPSQPRQDEDDDRMSDSGEDSDEEGPSGFVVAAQIKPETFAKVDKAYAKRKRAELAALGEWTHINCLKLSTHDNIQDSILRDLAYVPPSDEGTGGTRAGKPSRIHSLLDAIDLENLEPESALTVDQVPGGTISFLFEKGSNSAL
ncbi:hypothetical protein BD410DRAFT_745512 [Rickenella mellea]|uniref:DNA repair and recombination protein RAD54B n=1 Tax=Rickenella mellea TaxID=50990 RepID=A0A4Y7QBJ2_9AGAM|nr:hypothetical protein BD410DRAFT_745512 [Rickenella mellea]